MKPDKMANRLPPVADSAEAYNLARTIGMLVGCVSCQRRYRDKQGCFFVLGDSKSATWVVDWMCKKCVEDSDHEHLPR